MGPALVYMTQERERRIAVENKKAFTLIELTISIGILTVILTGMLRVIVHCARLSEASTKMTIAVNESTNILNEIRTHYNPIDHYGLDCEDDICTGTVYFNQLKSVASCNSETGCMGILSVDKSNPNLLKIELIRNWNSKFTKDNNFILVTYLAR